MLRLVLIGMLLWGSAAMHAVVAADSPELTQHLTTLPAIAAGANVFTTSWVSGGASAIHVFDALTLSYKGNMSGGSMPQVLFAHDGKVAYMASTYMKRIAYGPAEMVLQVFDVATLSPVKEIVLPRKVIMSLSVDSLLTQSADGKYVYVQNATPATSVTVVNIEEGRVAGEIPSPGCFGTYPSLQGHRFSAACGDGTFATFTLKADGASADRTQSAKIFDVDQDAIFIPSARVGADLVFVSFHGNVYRVNDRASTIKLVDRYSVTSGVDGGWAPGGSQLIAYNKSHSVLFIGMHPNAKEGSHKDPAKEIWAYNLVTKRLLYRTPVEDILSLTATDAPNPVVYASKAKVLLRYDADPEAKFALKKSCETYNPGPFNVVLAFRP